MTILKPLLPVLALASAVRGSYSSAKSIAADSPQGKSLLKRAVRTDIAVEDGDKPAPLRELEIANMAGMYIKYLGCSDFLQYGEYDWYQSAYNNANQNQNQNQGYQYQYNNNGQQGNNYNYNQNGQNGQGNYNYNQNGQNGNNQDQQQDQNGDQQAQNNNYNNGQYQNNYNNNANGQNQQNNYNGNAQQQQSEDVYIAHLVRFTLCSTQGCSGCQGEYAVDLVEFVENYAEIGMSSDEYACEKVRENCYCYNNYREQCYYDCYQQAGMDSCMDYYGAAQFQIQEYMECAQMDYYSNSYASNNQAAQNGGGYYYNQQAAAGQNYNYFVGPYCSNNADVYLGAFYDENCLRPAGKSTFSAAKYGESFPYFFEPIIKQGECISCMDPELRYESEQAANQQQYQQQYNNQVNYNNQQYQNNKNYNNQQYNQNQGGNNYNNAYNNYNRNYNYNGQGQAEQQEEVDYGDANELCEVAMQDSIKCDYYNGYTQGCDYINNVLPSLDGRRSLEGMYNSLFNRFTRSKKAAVIFGTTAAIMLALVGCMCGYMWTQDRSAVRIGLLESRRATEEFA